MGSNPVQACEFFSAFSLQLPMFLTLQQDGDLIRHFTTTFHIFHMQFTSYIHFVYSQSSLLLTIKTMSVLFTGQGEMTNATRRCLFVKERSFIKLYLSCKHFSLMCMVTSFAMTFTETKSLKLSSSLKFHEKAAKSSGAFSRCDFQLHTVFFLSVYFIGFCVKGAQMMTR